MITQAEVDEEQRRPVLSAHPLQRVGAFALAELGGVDHPEQLAPEQFDAVTRLMTQHLLGTVNVEKSQDPGGFWLGASYLFWPNSPMNPTNRKNQLPQERRDRIRQWRTIPDQAQWPDVPCALCGRPACGYYGKVDIPLGASTVYRNTTPRDHAGLALCFACLSCFHALPYGCEIGGGRAAVLHSWDDRFLRRFVRTQVGRTRRKAMVGTAQLKPPPYWREVTALNRLGSHDRRMSAGAELIVFSNSNKEQVFDEHTMEQPLAEWLRGTLRGEQYRDGFRYMKRAHQTKKVTGRAWLARTVFQNPQQVIGRVVSFLRAVSAESSTVPGEVPDLVPLSFSYASEVLQVNQRDVDRIGELAAHIAETLEPHREAGVLKGYETAHRDSGRLKDWLRKHAVSWALKRPDDRDEPFVTSEQWRLLFDLEGRSALHRDLLFIAVLEQLHQRGWRPDDVGGRDDLDDDPTAEED